MSPLSGSDQADEAEDDPPWKPNDIVYLRGRVERGLRPGDRVWYMVQITSGDSHLYLGIRADTLLSREDVVVDAQRPPAGTRLDDDPEWAEWARQNQAAEHDRDLRTRGMATGVEVGDLLGTDGPWS